MIKALILLSLTPFFVSGINVPYSHSLVRRDTRRVLVPPTLMERGSDLIARQDICIGVACDSGECCEGSCCGDGCCGFLYVCDTIDGVSGCCPVGEICTGSGGGCTDSSLVSCSGFDFCCAAGETCSLDANGNAQCNGVATGNGDGGGNDNSDSGTTTTTTTTYYNPPTGTTSTAQFTVVNTNTVATVRTTSTTSATLSSKTTTTTPFSSPSLLPATTSSDTTPNGAGRLVIEGSMSLFALSVGLLFV